MARILAGELHFLKISFSPLVTYPSVKNIAERPTKLLSLPGCVSEYRPAGAGNVVGHEWKSLVENSRSAEDATSSNNNQPRRGDTPTSFSDNIPHNSSNINLKNYDTTHQANSHGADGPLYKAGSGEALLSEEEAAVRDRERAERERDRQAPRWQGEIKIDILKELEDVANMTIAETGFFCKYVSFIVLFILVC